MAANLLFLYGRSGAGKTRLLQLIEGNMQGMQPTLRVGSERFVDELVQSLRLRSCSELFNKYATIENLLLDNLWIFRSHPCAAIDMGRLIQARMAGGKLTIIASDLPQQDVIRAFPGIGNCLKTADAVHVNVKY